MRRRTHLGVVAALCAVIVLAGCVGVQQPANGPNQTSASAAQVETTVTGFADHNITCVVYDEYGAQGNDNGIDCTYDTSPAPYNEDIGAYLTVVQQTNDTTCVLYDEYSAQGDDNDISCVNTDA